jgi:hypothetical protein
LHSPDGEKRGGVAGKIMAAADETRQLTDEFNSLAASTSIQTPALDELGSFISKMGLHANTTARSHHDRVA